MKSEAMSSVHEVLERLGIADTNSGACWGEWIEKPSGGELVSVSPCDGAPIGAVRMAGAEDYEQVMRRASDAFLNWRLVPAPKRGEIVRQIGDELRSHRTASGGSAEVRRPAAD